MDPRPLINVCDKHDMVEELTQYLHAKNMMKYIEVYVQKVTPPRSKPPPYAMSLTRCRA